MSTFFDIQLVERFEKEKYFHRTWDITQCLVGNKIIKFLCPTLWFPKKFYSNESMFYGDSFRRCVLEVGIQFQSIVSDLVRVN